MKGAQMTDRQEEIQPKTSSAREAWIDYLRGFGILLMIIGHTHVWNPIVQWIYGFHMPLFFMLSGYLFDPQKWFTSGYRKYLFKRAKNYLVPYFIWCGVCYLLNLPMLITTYHGDRLPAALLQNLGWILTSVRRDGVFLPQNCTALWFLTCLFLSAQVLYWLVKRKPVWQCV